MSIQYIFFDFGGCIDAPGIHTRVLFWDAYRKLELLPASQREEFQEAYTQADHRMMRTGEAKAMALREFNRHNSALIAAAMKLGKAEAEKAGDLVTAEMETYIGHSRKALVEFHRHWPLGIISNFTGNLEVILNEFQLRPLFDSVTESFYVNRSKPDPEIFRQALAKQKFLAPECLYVGDNPVNDIGPAALLGMQTALIHAPGKKRECGADFYVESLEDLLSYIQRP